MSRMIRRRLLVVVPLALIVSIGTFSMTSLLPGDPAAAIAGEQATPDMVADIRADLGLDDPFPVRYGRWFGGVVTGDLGTSYILRKEISAEMLRRIPVTASIGFMTILLAILMGVPIGLLQGFRSGTRLDRAVFAGTSAALAVPNFWLATLLVAVFAVKLQWLPSTGYTPFPEDPVGWFLKLILPSLALAVFTGAELSRQLRASLIQVQAESYVRAAYAKGLPSRKVLVKHALRNAAVPAVTVLGLRAGSLISGTVIVESIFAMPGLGQFAILSIQRRDIPSIQAVVLFAAVSVLLINLLIDVVYTWLNPKVRVA